MAEENENATKISLASENNVARHAPGVDEASAAELSAASDNSTASHLKRGAKEAGLAQRTVCATCRTDSSHGNSTNFDQSTDIVHNSRLGQRVTGR
jgi:hypothetical protein